MALSLVQGGSGFPYLAPPVFKYLCGQDIAEIRVAIEDVPNIEVHVFVKKARTLNLYY